MKRANSWFNPVLWQREWQDTKWLTLGTCLLMFLFGWIFVAIASQIDVGMLGLFFNALPSKWEKLSPIPFTRLATPIGFTTLLYVDPVVLFTCVIWAIGRGSSSVAGEIDRGTMEMLLAQPISRLSIMVVSFLITVIGAFMFAGSVWAGQMVGTTLMNFPPDTSGTVFLPAAINLFFTTYCLAGLTTLVSSFDRYRWRTVAVIGGFFLIELILKAISRMWAFGGPVVKYFTIFTAFEPQSLVLADDNQVSLMWQYNGTLGVVGTLAFIIAAVVFCRRDIPAPT